MNKTANTFGVRRVENVILLNLGLASGDTIRPIEQRRCDGSASIEGFGTTPPLSEYPFTLWAIAVPPTLIGQSRRQIAPLLSEKDRSQIVTLLSSQPLK
jgi:hypothetical protein